MLKCIALANITNIILGYKDKRHKCDNPAEESGTQECPILIEESPQKKASTDKKLALPAILRCKVKSKVRQPTSYRVTSALSYSPPLKTETVVIPESTSTHLKRKIQRVMKMICPSVANIIMMMNEIQCLKSQKKLTTLQISCEFYPVLTRTI